MNWLILRGLVRDQYRWDDFPKQFESQIPGSKIFCLDLPGLGTEIGRESPGTIESMVQDLRYRWLQLRKEAPGEWSILAVSLGGMCALHWLGSYIDDFKQGVIINSSASNLNALSARFQLHNLLPGIRAILTSDSWKRERLILAMTSQTVAKHPEVLESRKKRIRPEHQLSRNRFLSVAYRQLRAASVFRIRSRPRVPVIVLYSEGDRLVHPSCSVALAKFLNASTQVHPWAGHDLVLDDSAWVLEQVRLWLAQKA